MKLITLLSLLTAFNLSAVADSATFKETIRGADARIVGEAGLAEAKRLHAEACQQWLANWKTEPVNAQVSANCGVRADSPIVDGENKTIGYRSKSQGTVRVFSPYRLAREMDDVIGESSLSKETAWLNYQAACTAWKNEMRRRLAHRYVLSTCTGKYDAVAYGNGDINAYRSTGIVYYQR